MDGLGAMRTSLRWLVAFLSVAVAGYACYAYGVLSPGTTVAPAMRANFQLHALGILTHVLGSAVAIAVGPFQFFPSVRARSAWHRRLGMLYFTVVFIGGTSGFYMALRAEGGLVSRVGFALLAAAWLGSAGCALAQIKQGNFAAHERWAIRNFALTFAAVTLRVDMGLFFAAGFAFKQFYPLMGWLCWVPNVLVVEWILLPWLQPAQPVRIPKPVTATALTSET